MSSLENILQKDFTDKVRAEFRKYCLLLQAYSDTNSWVYECDFYLTDAIFWEVEVGIAEVWATFIPITWANRL